MMQNKDRYKRISKLIDDYRTLESKLIAPTPPNLPTDLNVKEELESYLKAYDEYEIEADIHKSEYENKEVNMRKIVRELRKEIPPQLHGKELFFELPNGSKVSIIIEINKQGFEFFQKKQ